MQASGPPFPASFRTKPFGVIVCPRAPAPPSSARSNPVSAPPLTQAPTAITQDPLGASQGACLLPSGASDAGERSSETRFSAPQPRHPPPVLALARPPPRASRDTPWAPFSFLLLRPCDRPPSNLAYHPGFEAQGGDSLANQDFFLLTPSVSRTPSLLPEPAPRCPPRSSASCGSTMRTPPNRASTLGLIPHSPSPVHRRSLRIVSPEDLVPTLPLT